jgi:hypothetical protein
MGILQSNTPRLEDTQAAVEVSNPNEDYTTTNNALPKRSKKIVWIILIIVAVVVNSTVAFLWL